METKNILNLESLSDIREKYEAPIIEIVEIKVEHGFQMSLSGDPDDEPTY